MEENKTKDVEGVIEYVEEKKTSTGKEMYVLKVGGEKYSNFGTLPDAIRDAWVNNEPVRISYVVKDNYRNIKNVTRLGKEQRKIQPEGEGKEKDGDFKSASEIDIYDIIIGKKATIMAKCYKEIEKILGRKPEADKEISMVNSLFIEANKNIGTAAMMRLIQRAQGKKNE